MSSPETPGVRLDDAHSRSCSWAEGPEGKGEVKKSLLSCVTYTCDDQVILQKPILL